MKMRFNTVSLIKKKILNKTLDLIKGRFYFHALSAAYFGAMTKTMVKECKHNFRPNYGNKKCPGAMGKIENIKCDEWGKKKTKHV